MSVCSNNGGKFGLILLNDMCEGNRPQENVPNSIFKIIAIQVKFAGKCKFQSRYGFLASLAKNFLSSRSQSLIRT